MSTMQPALKPTQLNAASRNSDPVAWRGGDGTLFVEGSVDGGSVELQWSLDNAGWNTATDADGLSLAVTDDFGTISFSIGNCYLRAALVGGTAPDVNVSIQPR